MTAFAPKRTCANKGLLEHPFLKSPRQTIRLPLWGKGRHWGTYNNPRTVVCRVDAQQAGDFTQILKTRAVRGFASHVSVIA
jgi:hypothetical protein